MSHSPRDRRAEVLRRRAARLARKDSVAHEREEGLEIAEIAVGRERFGIPVTGLREIVPIPHVTRLPGLPPWIVGIAQIRGELVSVIELSTWFRIEAEGASSFLALVETDRGALGLTADEVLGFRRVGSHELAPVAETGNGRPISHITHDLVAILDLAALASSRDLIVE